ncbi:MAG TPA: hypothetical protein VJG90_08845 [Candidatus Nanoarchaeia archaeon]|nr:hypothetical protein [Candidatus Nanoarchaeia archaeon]
MTLKSFEEYVTEGIVKKVSKNKERAKSLLEESERKMRSLKERLEKLGIKDENANDYVEYCYDLLLHLVRAKLYLDGYSASGQGAHEAEVAYLRKLGFTETEVRFADQVRYFRNGILYYGTSLDAEYAQKVVAFTKKIQPQLIKLVKE